MSNAESLTQALDSIIARLISDTVDAEREYQRGTSVRIPALLDELRTQCIVRLRTLAAGTQIRRSGPRDRRAN